MTKKNKIALCAAAVAGAAIIIGSGVSLAYLGASNSKDNSLTVGYADESLLESNFSAPSEVSVTSNPAITKQFSVRNNGSVPAFARIYAEFSDSDLAAHAKVTLGNNAPVSWETFKTNLNYTNPVTDSKWRFVPLSDGTQDGKIKGYFYYTEALAVGGETPNLFDSVTIDYARYDGNSELQDGSNIDLITPLEMIVYSELVQTVETGSLTSTVNGETVKIYGYDYGTDNQWLAAWKSFLKVT